MNFPSPQTPRAPCLLLRLSFPTSSRRPAWLLSRPSQPVSSRPQTSLCVHIPTPSSCSASKSLKATETLQRSSECLLLGQLSMFVSVFCRACSLFAHDCLVGQAGRSELKSSIAGEYRVAVVENESNIAGIGGGFTPRYQHLILPLFPAHHQPCTTQPHLPFPPSIPPVEK